MADGGDREPSISGVRPWGMLAVLLLVYVLNFVDR